MSSCPTIRIAMFGSRSTGKTTFLSSFVSGRSEQGCSVNGSNDLDKETQNYLHGLWQQLLEGHVANTTDVTFTEDLLFNFRYQVQGTKKNEWSWKLVFRDYAGKLFESEVPIEPSDSGSREDAKAIEDTKEKLKKYMKQADACLFLVPVDIPDWSPVKQQLYIAYINDVINNVKESREGYSRSIPFCIALTKWDTTDIVTPPTTINPDSTYTFPAEVEKYFKQYPIFGEIYDTISRQTNDTVPIFATSVFGTHLKDNKEKPILGQVKPYNTLPILHWLCTKVEQVRWELLEREIETLMSQPDSHEKFRQISHVYDEFLARGVNDSAKIEELARLQKENREKHIDFKYKEVDEKISAINNDARCKDKGKEIVIVLKEQLESGLFRVDDERRIQHDIEDNQNASCKIVGKRNRQKVYWGFVTILAICIIVYCVFTGYYYCKFANAFSLLGTNSDLVKVPELEKVEQTANIAPLWWEKYNPVVTGMREGIRERHQGIIKNRRQECDDNFNTMTDLSEKINFIKNMDKKYYPAVIVKEYEDKIPSLQVQLKEQYDKDLQAELSSLESQEHPQPYQFSKQAELAGNKAKIYDKYAPKYAAAFPKENNPYTAKYNDCDKLAQTLSTQDYKDFELKYGNLLGLPNNFEKLNAAQELLKVKDSLLHANPDIWKELDSIITDCINAEWENFERELQDYPNISSDPIEKRQENYKERKRIYAKYRELFTKRNIEDKVKEITNIENNDNPNLDNEQRFKNAYQKVKDSENVKELEDFLRDFSADCYKGLPNYNQWMGNIKKRRDEQKLQDKIEELVYDCKEFEKEFESKKNNQTFKEYNDKITALQIRCKEYQEDKEVKIWLDKLEDISAKNNRAWEQAEYQKVLNAEKTLLEQPTIENIGKVIEAAKKYVENPDSPKEQNIAILTYKEAYDKLKEFLTQSDIKTLAITIKSYDVSNTGFDNRLDGTKIEFDFWGNCDKALLKFNAAQGLQNPITFPFKIHRNDNLKLQLKDIHPGGEDANSHERLFFSTEILDCIKKQNNSFIYRFTFPHRTIGGHNWFGWKDATIDIEVSGFPAPPKKLQPLKKEAPIGL